MIGDPGLPADHRRHTGIGNGGGQAIQRSLYGPLTTPAAIEDDQLQGPAAREGAGQPGGGHRAAIGSLATDQDMPLLRHAAMSDVVENMGLACAKPLDE